MGGWFHSWKRILMPPGRWQQPASNPAPPVGEKPPHSQNRGRFGAPRGRAKEERHDPGGWGDASKPRNFHIHLKNKLHLPSDDQLWASSAPTIHPGRSHPRNWRIRVEPARIFMCLFKFGINIWIVCSAWWEQRCLTFDWSCIKILFNSLKKFEYETKVLYKTKVLKLALTEELLTRTRFFGAGLFGRSAGLSCPDAVGRQDSELVLHPGT